MKRSVGIIVLLFACLFAHGQAPTLERGFLDLSKWNFKQDGSVALQGEWEFYMHSLVTPDQFSKDNPVVDYTSFPSFWNAYSKSLKPGNGYATYRAHLVINKNENLAIDLPSFYTSYRMWINGKAIASNGIVGTNELETKPQYLPLTIPLTPGTDTLTLVLQVSNFSHANGGLKDDILIGEASRLLQTRETAMNSTIVLFVFLATLAVAFVLLYLFFHSDRSALYLGALAATWGLRSLFSNLYVFNQYFPEFSWEIGAKIEYITIYLTMVWSILMVGELFKGDINRFFKYILVGGNVIFSVLTVITNASVYTQFLPVYLSVAGILIAYVIYVLIRALIYDRTGIWLVVIAGVFGAGVFGFDIVSFQGFTYYHPLIRNIGYLLMFAMLAMAVGYKMGMLRKGAREADMLRYEDFYGPSKS